jgi:hypothetical protein
MDNKENYFSDSDAVLAPGLADRYQQLGKLLLIPANRESNLSTKKMTSHFFKSLEHIFFTLFDIDVTTSSLTAALLFCIFKGLSSILMDAYSVIVAHCPAVEITRE